MVVWWKTHKKKCKWQYGTLLLHVFHVALDFASLSTFGGCYILKIPIPQKEPVKIAMHHFYQWHQCLVFSMGLGFHTRHVLYSSRLNSTTFASHGIAAAAAASAVHHEYSLHKESAAETERYLRNCPLKPILTKLLFLISCLSVRSFKCWWHGERWLLPVSSQDVHYSPSVVVTGTLCTWRSSISCLGNGNMPQMEFTSGMGFTLELCCCNI